MIETILKDIDILKQKVDALRPMPPEMVKQLKEYYRIGLTYTSNALEGNSLTELETKVVLEDGLTVSGKPLRDHFEAAGHSLAYDFMYESVGHNISEVVIKKLHHLFYYHIDLTHAGNYRDVQVYISGSDHKFPKPYDVPILMQRFASKLDEWQKTLHPVLLSAKIHKEFVFVHPFIDGNGRVARLLMNLVLLQQGYGLAIIPPILRMDYIRCLQRAHEHGDDEFNEFIAYRVKETLKDYMRLIG